MWSLKRDKSITILLADHGNVTVVLDRTEYNKIEYMIKIGNYQILHKKDAYHKLPVIIQLAKFLLTLLGLLQVKTNTYIKSSAQFVDLDLSDQFNNFDVKSTSSRSNRGRSEKTTRGPHST